MDIFIGIDQSINSTGVTVNIENNEYFIGKKKSKRFFEVDILW